MNKFIAKRNRTKFVSAAAIFLGLIIAFSALILPHLSAQTVQTDNNSTAPILNPRAAAGSYADIVQKVSPSVVTIRSDIKVTSGGGDDDMSQLQNNPLLKQFFGGKVPQMKPQTEHALGSGVVVGADGIILTNNHVVDKAEKIQVELLNRKTYAAKVIGTDPLSDLAVLKIDAANLPALALGDSDKVRVGDVVLALGNPLGLRQTVTSGIISAKGRATGLSDGSFEDFLQTDAAINQGNSGGALVDLDGELVGINSQIISPSGGSIGIGFAIPSNMAKSVMSQLVATGKVRRGMLGIGIQDLNSDLANSFGLKDNFGVLINSVKAGSPADKAGIKQGDVVTAVGGVNVVDSNEFRNKIANTAPGTDVNLTVMRDGREQTFTTKLGEFNPEQIAANDKNTDKSGDTENLSAGGKLGLQVEPLTPAIAGQLGLKDVKGGLVITGVQAGSKAEDAGLQQGDVIMQINRRSVNTLSDVKTALTASGDKPVLLLVNRQNQTSYVTI